MRVLHVAECCRPFWAKRLDILDCMLSAAMLFHCVASLYFANSSFDELEALHLERSLIAANLGVVATAFGLFIMSLLEDKFKTAAISGLAGGVASLIVSLQLKMRGCAQPLLRALEEATRGIPPLTDGCRVSHGKHGLGVLIAVILDDVRGKPCHVLFDSGENRHYSLESAAEKLQAYKDRGNAPEDAVLLDEFQQGVHQCLQSDIISPAALEALFRISNSWTRRRTPKCTRRKPGFPCAWYLFLPRVRAFPFGFGAAFAGSRIPRRASIVQNQVSRRHNISIRHGQATLEIFEAMASRSRCSAERSFCARKRLSASRNGVEQFASEEDDAQTLRRNSEVSGAGCVPKMDTEKSHK
jgi:hypothetical protein